MKFSKGSHHLASSVVYLSFWGLSAFSMDSPKPLQSNFCQTQPTKDTCRHGLFVFLRAVLGAALLQVPADRILFVRRLWEAELCLSVVPGTAATECHHLVLPAMCLSLVPTWLSFSWVSLFLLGLVFALMPSFDWYDVLSCPILFSCVLAGMSSGFFPPPSGRPGWGQNSEKGQDSIKVGNAFGDCVRQKLAPARLLLLVPGLCGKAGFHIPPSSQTGTLHVWQADDWGRLGFVVGPNSGWTWWCENPSSVLPVADNSCCDVWLLRCVYMAVEQRGLSLWMLDRCSWRVVSPPHSCSRENGLLPRQEVKSFTGHSPSWSSRHLAGFSKPWLTAASLLWAVLLLNLGGKCFYEREGNLSCALLILLSLDAFQSHSKPLQLNKWKHQVAQCVVWQTSQPKVTSRETPAFSKEKGLLNSKVSGKELPFFEMLTWVWLVTQQCHFISLLVLCPPCWPLSMATCEKGLSGGETGRKFLRSTSLGLGCTCIYLW